MKKIIISISKIFWGYLILMIGTITLIVNTSFILIQYSEDGWIKVSDLSISLETLIFVVICGIITSLIPIIYGLHVLSKEIFCPLSKKETIGIMKTFESEYIELLDKNQKHINWLIKRRDNIQKEYDILNIDIPKEVTRKCANGGKLRAHNEILNYLQTH